MLEIFVCVFLFIIGLVLNIMLDRVESIYLIMKHINNLTEDDLDKIYDQDEKK